VRSRPDLHVLRVWGVLAVLACAPAWPDTARPATMAEVDHAIQAVKADPNLATEEKAKRLVWDSDEKKERKSTHNYGWQWLADLFGWLAGTSAVIVWVLLAGLAALLVVFIARVVMKHRLPERGRSFVAPTHVQDLDIRPESLPPDIGAAARAWWDRGEQRAALALLYRGMLSRLAHVHEVAIRDSSTEGDCLTLAARKLDPARVDYVTQLIRTWQRAIYGGITADTAQVWDLCARFAANLDGPVHSDSLGHKPLFASA
jgi:hypothetical protein